MRESVASVAAVEWVEDEWCAAPGESSPSVAAPAPATSPRSTNGPPKRLNSLASSFLPAAIFARTSPPAAARLLARAAPADGGDDDGEECDGEGGRYAAWEEDGEGGEEGGERHGGFAEGGVGSALLSWGRNLFHRPPPASLSPPSTLLQPLAPVDPRVPSAFRHHAATTTVGGSTSSGADAAQSLAGKLWGVLAPRSTHAQLLGDVSGCGANGITPHHSLRGAARQAAPDGARSTATGGAAVESARSAPAQAFSAPGGVRGRGNWSAVGGAVSSLGGLGSREGAGRTGSGGSDGEGGGAGRGSGDGGGAHGDGRGGAGGGHRWRQKVMEVLPVLAVVTLMVFGTVAYLTVVDAILPRLRPAFSLSCPLDRGRWALSSRRPLYPPSCPFLRDDFNCAKFGLSAPDTWRWEPSQCQVAEFSAEAWLQGMAGRRVAYVGDKAVANAFDSMLCMLAQADTPTALPDASPRRTLLAPSEPPTTRTDASKGRGGGGETSPRQAVSGGRQGESVRAAADGRVFIGALDAPPSALHAPHAALDAPLAARAASMVQTGVRGSEGAGSDVRRGGGRHKKAGWGWNPIRWGGWRRASSAQQHVGAADAGTGDASSASGSTDHTSTPPAAAYSASFALFDMQPLLYVFPRHNVTLAFLPSPFLVKASLLSPVNATLCQLQRAAAATALNTSAANSSSSSSIGGSTSQAPEHAEGASPAGSSGGGEGVVRDACYPNRIHVDEPDPAWAQQAALFDAVVLASGRSWTEDAVETHGLSVVVGGVRQSNLSVEGLVGQWAYPLAMAAVTSWLANASHFNGTAVFRSFSPTHPRKQCAARMLLPDAEHASEVMEEARRYDDAVARAIGVAAGARGSSSSTAAGGAAAGGVAGRALPRLHLMNVSLLTAQRADAHPWMASPVRPKADCTDWCLPGVPDTWNELLAATLLKLLQR